MAIVETRLSNCYHNFIFPINFYNCDIKFLWNLLYFFKCQSVKNFVVFSNLQVSSPKISQNKVLTLAKMVSINYLCHNIAVQWQSQEAITLAMILSLRIGKHRFNLLGFKQCLRRTFSKKYSWVPWQMRKKQGY